MAVYFLNGIIKCCQVRYGSFHSNLAIWCRGIDPVHEAKTEDAIAYLDQSPAAKRAMLKVGLKSQNKKSSSISCFFYFRAKLTSVR